MLIIFIAYYDPSMKLVAYIEIIIFARVFFGLLLWRNSLIMPIVYGLFLRSRYFHSLFTRQAFATVDAVVLETLAKPQVVSAAPQAKKYYDVAKGYLSKALGTTVIVPATEPQGGNKKGN